MWNDDVRDQLKDYLYIILFCEESWKEDEAFNNK